MTDYSKLNLEEIRADLAKMAHERPPLPQNARDLLEAFLPELDALLKGGFSVRQITERLNQHGVDLRIATIQWHLRQMRASTKKPRRRSPAAKPEAATQPADKPAPASNESKATAVDLFDQAENEGAF